MITCRNAVLFIFSTFCLIFPSAARSNEVAELNDLLNNYAEKQKEISLPFVESRNGLRAKYEAMLKPLLANATRQGNLSQALVVKKELEGLSLGRLSELAEDVPEDLSRLRNIYDSELEKIDTKEKEELGKLIPLLIESLDNLEIMLTKNARLNDAVVVNSVKVRFQKESTNFVASQSTSPSETISRSELERRREEGGKLRIEGAFLPGMPAMIPELDKLPSDFISVFAFRSSWVALRANGKSLVIGLNRDKTVVESTDDMNIRLIGNGYDAFIYTKDKMLHRLVNWELNHLNATISNPIALAGGHATGLLLNSRGDPEARGGSTLAVPPEDFRRNIKALASTKHTFLTLSEDGVARIWNMREGREMKSPELEARKIERIEGGQSHYLIEDIEGHVIAIDVSGSSAVSGFVPNFAHSPHQIRAGGNMSAVQMLDGTWKAWGEDNALSDTVDRAGKANDLDLYSGESSEYVIWIENPTD